MKKVWLFLVFIASGMQYVSAQDNYPDTERRLRFGAYVAPNLSWMKPTAGKSDDGRFSVEGAGSRAGYSWGLIADYFFQEHYGISTGFHLNTTGGKVRTENTAQAVYPGTVQTTDFNYQVQYLEIPFALKLRTDQIGGVYFFGQIGLTAGINISKKASYEVTYADEQGNLQEVSGRNEKLVGSLTMAPAMLQMNIGGGVEVPLSGNLSFYTGLFFNNGFLPDATRPEKFGLGYAGNFSDGNVRLNSLSLRLGLLF